jgi:hypothetical protein
MLAPILATAAGDQTSPRVAVVLDPDERQGLADDMDVQGQRDGGLDRTVQRPELPIIVGATPMIWARRSSPSSASPLGGLRHEVFTDLSAPAPSAYMPGSLHAGLTEGR